MRKKRRKKARRADPITKRLVHLEKRVDRLSLSSGLPSLPPTFRSSDFGTPTARYSSAVASRGSLRQSAPPPSTESYSARAVRPTIRSGE